MKAPGRPRSTRDRPAKAPLSEEAIVEAALATGPGSLYVYVEGRDGLLMAMFDRVVAAVRLEPPDPARWRAQVHGLLARLRDELVRHPGLAAATMVDPPQTEAALRLLENLLGLLLAGGLDVQAAAWACDILSAQVTYAAIEAEVRRTDPGVLAAQIAANFARLPA